MAREEPSEISLVGWLEEPDARVARTARLVSQHATNLYAAQRLAALRDETRHETGGVSHE